MRKFKDYGDFIAQNVIGKLIKNSTGKALVDEMPELMKQIALVNSKDFNFRGINGIQFADCSVPKELAPLFAPTRVSIVTGLNGFDYLDRTEFDSEAETPEFWDEARWGQFTALFYNVLRISPENATKISDLRKEVTLNSDESRRFAIMKDGEAYALSDFDRFPFVLTIPTMRESAYCEGVEVIRQGYLSTKFAQDIQIR
jgi:hypothetical protein